MKTALVYVHVMKSAIGAPDHYAPFSHRFVTTYEQFRPATPHAVVVVCCGGIADDARPLFDRLNPFENVRYVRYNGNGWDIGAMQSVAWAINCEFAVFIGACCYFWRPGWLERLVDCHRAWGDGLYAPMASFEMRPHLRTCCFACSPKLLREYPITVDSGESRREFETGAGSIAEFTIASKMPCKMVTWEGSYDRSHWRDPENIFRRGDQSNCMIRDRHTDIYAEATPEEQARLARLADGK